MAPVLEQQDDPAAVLILCLPPPEVEPMVLLVQPPVEQAVDQIVLSLALHEDAQVFVCGELDVTEVEALPLDGEVGGRLAGGGHGREEGVVQRLLGAWHGHAEKVTMGHDRRTVSAPPLFLGFPPRIS